MRVITLFLSLLVFIPTASYAEEFKVESNLLAATVYTNRALLTRKVKVDVSKGSHIIIFKNLPANLLPDSLRAEGEAISKVTFGALTHKRIVEAGLTVPKEKELTDKIETLYDARKIIDAEKSALNTKDSFLNNIGKQAGLRINEELAEMNLKPEQWALAADILKKGSEQSLKERLVLEVQQRELDRKITVLQKELGMLRTGQRSSLQVSVPLDVDSETTVTIHLSYQIPNASWRPLYDARLNTNDSELELIQYGAVRQQTGEDWNNIALTLSTAQPHRGASLPPLSPMWVSIYQSGGQGYGRSDLSSIASNIAKPMSAPARFAAEKSAAFESHGLELEEDMAPKPAEFQVAEINTSGFVSEYVIPGVSSVLADGSESKLLIGKFENESVLEVQVKPQLSNAAMLVAYTKLKGDSPILPGPVSLFRDGSYVGQVHIPMLRPDESQYLGFGIDDQISVTRRALKDEKGEEGLIGKDTTLERHFLSEIKNLHDRNIDVTVLQTIPVSKDDRIKVKLLPHNTSKGYEVDYDNIKGQLRWKISMGPKKQSNINLGWEVSWPADFSINGM